MSDVFDEIQSSLKGQGKGLFTGAQPGTTYTGTITSIAYKQQVDYQTGQPATFPSGDPKMQYVIRLHVPALVSSEDDGNRALYIKAWGVQRDWLLQAIEATGLKDANGKPSARLALAPGGEFTATFVREEKVQGKTGTYTQNVYQYQITPAAVATLNQAPAPAPAYQAPAPAAAPAYQAPAPAAPAAPAAAAPAAPPAAPAAANPVELAKQLHAAGVPIAQIVTQTGLEETTLHAILADY